MSKIKHYFATGLLITLPVFFTCYLLYIIFIFIDGIWGKAINFYLKKYLGFSIPGLGIALGLVTILAVGFIATNFLGKKLFKLFEGWFLKIPFIRKIYPAARQIVDSFISRKGPAFKKVVLVEYPSRGIWSVGFITNDSFREANEKLGQELVHVFIGTAPNPLTGSLILVPKRDIKILDISVEEGIKLIVSGGIVKPAD
ncbi:MAG: DUF502 domain-containing protein [Candidatus Omnitrophota bacterium]